MIFIEAKDLALRYHCKLPDWDEDDPRAALWIAAITELPLAEQQGRPVPPLAKPTDWPDSFNASHTTTWSRNADRRYRP